jgi:hypothetical protein
VKKVISIVFAVCVLFSGVHLTVSTHYCGGKLADKAVSLTGRIATCGMEGCENKCPVHGSQLDATCCQTDIYMYSVDNHYTPASSLYTCPFHDNLQVSGIYTVTSVYDAENVNPTYKNEYPPGVLLSTQVDLCEICVFRI